MKLHLNALAIVGLGTLLLGTSIGQPLLGSQGLSNAELRDIEVYSANLSAFAKDLHDEYHEHLEGITHAARLDEYVTQLERKADALNRFATQQDGRVDAVRQLRNDTNELIQLSVKIARTINLTELWLRGGYARLGTQHMRSAARDVLRVALAIDAFLPVDTTVIDNQAVDLESAVKELHDEFHEHLESYEISAHLDADLEELESHVEHVHDLAHDKAWAQIEFRRVADNLREIKAKTHHIESLFVRQSEIGVRTRDFIGIEHSRDAITDVLSSVYLLEHMIAKADPPRARRWNGHGSRRNRVVPRRDRHGHLEAFRYRYIGH